MAYEIQITPEMKRQFHSETVEHLNLFEKMLMLMEKEPDHPEAVHSAFRAIHSLKGNSAYLDVNDINALAHDLEDLMDGMRDGKIPVCPNALSLLFDGLDLLRDMNRRVTDEDYEETDISHIRARILQAKAVTGGDGKEEKNAISDSELFSDIFDQDIKVDIGKIDEFISHISEFTINKNTLNHLTEKLVSGDTDDDCRGQLRKTAENINRIADTLQNDVMRLRLVRLKTLFERLPRLVRAISLKSGKEIELLLSGGETEVDRKTVEQLADPLLHLIRNAADHGVESPSERLGKGKPSCGTIRIRARQEGNCAVLDVSDDGKGLDREDIARKALEKKLVSQDDIRTMKDEEVLNLIFLPGFTTRSDTTEISGRGVGLDVVRNNVAMMGGGVSVSGQKDAGTRVILRIPLSMSLTEVLLTEVSGRRYGFPFSSILKAARLAKKKIRSYKDREFFVFGESLVPVRHLAELLDIEKKGKIGSRHSEEEISLVVLASGKERFAIAIDNILKRENILVRPLEKCLAGIREFSGTALLGDGSIALVIDPMGIGY